MNAEFEKYAKDQFDHYEVPVDAEALWAEIAPVLKPKKDNRRFLWFFLGGLLIGSLVVGSLFQSLQETSESQVLSLNVAPAKTSEHTVDDKEESAANDPLPVSNVTVAENINNANSNDLNNKASQNTVAAKSNLVADNSNSINKLNARLSNSSKAKVVTGDTQFTEAPSNSFNTGQEVASAIPPVKTSQQKPLEAFEASGSTLLIDEEKPEGFDVLNTDIWKVSVKQLPLLFAELADESALRKDADNRPGRSVSNAADQRFAKEAEVLEAVKARFEQSDISAPVNTSEYHKKSQKQRSALLRDVRFGLGLYGGISRSTTELSPRNAQSSEYELLRINSEKQLETLHAGFNALIVSDDKLYLRTGAEYTRIGSLFSQSAERVEVDSVPGVVEIQINQFTGDTTEIMGYLMRTRTTRYTKKSYNYFHLVDVPVILGYNFGSEDLTIGIEAGIYANIMVKNKGEVFQQDESFYDKKKDPQGWYKNNVGISPFIGCNVAYHFNDNLQIHFSPGFRFPSVFSTDANPLIEKHSNLGVQAGVRYIFDNY